MPRQVLTVLLLCFSSISFSNTYPFEVRNDFILCEATIDGKTVTLLLDSGAPGLVLHERYYAQDEISEGLICSGINGPFICQTRRINSWEWLGIEFKKTDALLSDLTFLERATGRRIDGLAGLSLLRRYYVTLNLDQHAIEIHKECNESAIFTSFQYAAHVPVVSCIVNGKTKRLGIDTGAETNYLFNYPVKADKTTKHIMVTGTENRSELRHILSMEVQMLTTQPMQKLDFVIDPSAKSFLADYPIDGLLGQDFLTQFNITIHPGKQKIHFEPRVDATKDIGSVIFTD